MESAKSAVIFAQNAIFDPRRVNRSSTQSQQRLLGAQSKLDAAVKEYDSIKNRNDLIDEFTEETKNSRIAKRNAERHSILLRWMLQQLPLIDLELKQSKTAGNGSDGGIRRSRLKLDRADELGEGQGPTDQSNDDGENTKTSDHRTRISSTSQGSERGKRRPDTVDEERRSKRPRHNGHNLDTAATGDASNTAAARTVRGEWTLASLADKRGQGVKAGMFLAQALRYEEVSRLHQTLRSLLQPPNPSVAALELRKENNDCVPRSRHHPIPSNVPIKRSPSQCRCQRLP